MSNSRPAQSPRPMGSTAPCATGAKATKPARLASRPPRAKQRGPTVFFHLFHGLRPEAPQESIISQVARVGNTIHFSFNADSNRTYAVEKRGSVSAGTWATLTNIPAQPSAATINVADALSPTNAFYRVRTP